MKRTRLWVVFPIVLCAAIAFSLPVGCRKKPASPPPQAEQPAPVPAAKVEPPKPAPAPEKPKVETYVAPETETTRQVAPPSTPPPAPPPPPKPEVKLGDVFFAFDKYDLTSESRNTLARNADALKADGSIKVLIEGHCDERGTNEYNLGLGERRAKAAKDYLVSLGVAASRIETISYGEERPFAQGHDESAWSQNRRGHFVKR